MRLALGIEYDGRAFCGWQTQPSGCGVEDALEAALGSIAGHPVDVICAGRTDTGVHATGQVVHFDTTAARPETAWTRGVNAFLPDGVSVLWCRAVGEDFHARYAARSRTYRYLLLSRPARPGLSKGRVGWYHGPLSEVAMREAAGLLIGEHDFSAFRAAECQAATPVRHLTALNLHERDGLFVFDITANAFLQHMVRNIVGALVYVGAGRHPPSWMSEVLASRDRRVAAPTFSPDGLYLWKVDYDPAHGLPEASPPPGPL